MIIKNIVTRKNTLIFVIAIWLVFSVYYVANDQWQNFKLNYSQRAYQQGVSDSVKTLITQVEKCKQVPLFYKDKKVEVVSIDCLKKDNQSEQKSK